MKVELRPDFDVTEESCKSATGKSLSAWFDEVASRPELKGKRREAINMYLYPEMGRGKDTWWPTTVWVEWERSQEILQKDGKIEGYNICVTKNIAAPVSAVFTAWSGPALATWFGENAKAESDGSIADATGNKATALRVRQDKDLRFTWRTAGSPDATSVDVMFKEAAGKTLVTLTHNRIQTRAEADGLRRAWSDAFSRLKQMLEA